MKQYNIDKKIKKVSRPEGWAILGIILGAILLIFERWRAIHSFRDLVSILDSLFFPIIGIVVLIDVSKRLKKIRGSYLNIDADKIAFKSRGVEKEFNDFSEIKSISVKLDTILITENTNSTFTLFLDDYIGNGEQSEIKEYFNNLKLTLTNKSE